MNTLLLLVGESGCGKSTLMRNLLKHWPLRYNLILSTTTRLIRVGEYHGIDYYFHTLEEYHALAAQEAPVQETQFGGNYYATFPKDYVRDDREVGVLAVVPQHIATIERAFPDKKVKHVFFNTSDGLLRRHLDHLPEEKVDERIRRGQIKQDYFKLYKHQKPKDSFWLCDANINDNLHLLVHEFVKGIR